jgi:radical SAM superfamily enzyme YgiQ (UPF0313 family)
MPGTNPLAGPFAGEWRLVHAPGRVYLNPIMKILLVIHDLITIPLGISYISAVARERGHDVEVASLSEEDLSRAVRDFGPDVVAFGATSGFHQTYLDAVASIRDSTDAVTVMGGAHATFFPEVVLENPQLDFCLRGESEEAFLQLLEHLEGKRPADEVGNLVRSRDGEMVMNPLLPLQQDLDSIPFPDRTFYNRYGMANRRAVFVITGRGCPYGCTYCFNHAFKRLYSGLGMTCRKRSVGNVLEEIRRLRGMMPSLSMIVFQDDIFILDREWTLEFCRRYPREVGLPFHCHLRANLVDEEIARALKRAGCHSIKMAIESASPRLRNDILGRNMSNATIERAFRAVREAGIVIVSQNILALPTGTFEDDLDTLRLNCRLKPDFAFATLLQPYPRTQIGEFCRDRGLLRDDAGDSLPDSFFDGTVLEVPDRERRERLRKLFALSIEFPFLRGRLKWLTRLPLDGLYDLLDRVWKGFCIKQREFPYSMPLREYVRSAVDYLRTRYY